VGAGSGETTAGTTSAALWVSRCQVNSCCGDKARRWATALTVAPGSKLSAMAPVLTLPEAFILRNGAFVRGVRINIYILINNKVERDFQLVPNSTIEIAARTSASVTKTQTRSILYETFDFARRNKFGFNLTYIDKGFPSSDSSGFETNYMRSLYQYGYDKAKTGNFWVKVPPSDDVSSSGFRFKSSAM
jgi:hypothetical protein